MTEYPTDDIRRQLQAITVASKLGEAVVNRAVEILGQLEAENASLVALFKQVSDRVFPGHTDSVGAVREIVAEKAKLTERLRQRENEFMLDWESLRKEYEGVVAENARLRADYKDVSERLESSTSYTVNYVDKLRAVVEAAKRADDSATDEEGALAYWSADCRAIKRALAALDEVVG